MKETRFGTAAVSLIMAIASVITDRVSLAIFALILMLNAIFMALEARNPK